MTDLPDSWEWSTLGEIASWGSGGTPKRSEPSYYGGDIPWVVIGDLTDGTVHQTAGHLSPEGLANSSAKLVPAGAILVAMYGSIGKLGIAATDLTTNQAIAACVTEPDLESRFIFWYLRSQRGQLSDAGKGAAQQNIGQGTLKAWAVPVPPRAEQERIVAAIEEHLSRLDAADSQLHAVAVRQEQLRGLALAGLFEERWPRSPLIDVVDLFSDCPHRTPKYEPLGTHPALRPRDVVGGELEINGAARVNDREYSVQTAKAVPLPGDVVYSRELSFGWAGVLEEEGACLSQGMVLIRCSQVLPRFLTTFLNSTHGRQQAMTAAAGSAHPHVNLRDIKAFEVPHPPAEDQEYLLVRAAEITDGSRRVLDAVGQARRRIAALRRSILAAAFAGTLVPQDPDDEPAAVLLQRIRAERG